MPEKGLIHFIHGKESGPHGSKIAALSDVARNDGWQVSSLDYSHTTDPAERLEQLLATCVDERRRRVLVGSSMGAWVAAEAAERLGAQGVFLLAPYASAVRFARLRQCTLHLVQDDHRLNARIPLLCELFAAFLKKMPAHG